MKRALPLFSLLLLPQLVWGQDAPTVPAPATLPANLPPEALAMTKGLTFALNEDNARAVAMLGTLYNSFQNASSYKGHWTMTQTNAKDGKATSTNSLELTASWQVDAKTGARKSRNEMVYTKTVDGKETTERYIKVSDGTKTRRYYSDRNVWMEEPQTEKTSQDLSEFAVKIPWTVALVSVPLGSTFQIEKLPDNTTVLSTDDKVLEAVLNPDGSPASWRMGRVGKSVTTLAVDDWKLNGPIDSKDLAWKVPTGAKQIPPEDPKNTFEFNFDF